MQVVCPSGLSGEIRKLKVREENLLADAKKMRRGAGLNEVLANVWVQTTNKGPYSFDDRPDWSRVLMGDHFYATIFMRVVLRGPDYDFRVPCPNQFCRSSIEWEIDLAKLPVKKLSEKSKEIWMRDNRFEAHIESSGKRVVFKLLQANAQKQFMRIKRDERDRLITASMRMQIIEIDGIQKKDLNDFIDDMDSDDASDLREQFDDAGCGIETEIEIECQECDHMFEVELPFGGRDFFSHRKKKPKPAKKPNKEKGPDKINSLMSAT